MSVQVNFVKKYVLTVSFVQLSISSKYVGSDAAMIPKPSHQMLAWQGLTDLRMSLLERGLLNEALSLFKVERTRLPPTERADATLWFLEHTNSYTSLTQERSIWIEMELKIFLAQSLYERREVSRGEAEFLRAEELLDAWCELAQYSSRETLAPRLDIKFLRLSYGSNDDVKVHFGESTQLLQILKACCHSSTVACYRQATEAAYELALKDTMNGHYLAQFFRLHEEQEVYQETLQEDVCGLLFDQQDFFQYAAKITADSQNAMEWLGNFLERYPGFNLPNGLMGIHRIRKLAYQRLADPKRVAQEEDEIKKLETAVPERFGTLVGVRRSNAASTVAQNPTDGSDVELRFALDIEEESFLADWHYTMSDNESRWRLALHKMLEWMIADLDDGVVSADEISAILALQDVDENHESLARRLEAIPPDRVFAILYHESAGEEIIPIKASAWNARSEILKRWLSRDQGPMNNSRQHLRSVLQEIRKDTVCQSQMPLDTKIWEIERCMSMAEELPPRVKENVIRREQAWWHGGIAYQIYLHYCSCPDQFNSDDVGSYIARAETECQRSMMEYQAKGDVASVAMRQRLTAELCVMKIRWLQQRKDEVFKEADLEDIRKIGLQNVEKAESYFASKRQESTWDRNLEGFEQRERATYSENSWRVPQIAMQLLDAGDAQAHESRRTEMWKWVQRAKARSLATSMGLGGVIPEALLNDVLASESSRPSYEKMVSLQSQILSAQPHKRFALRHELDLHLKVMRNNPLLREVCDLKDGMPLTLSDVDRITSVANTALVLVDWYVVPDFLGEGRLMLLTARAGRTPTVTTLTMPTRDPIDWVTRYLDSSMSQQRSKDSSGLNALVQPLIDLTDPRDVLVFCPSAALHRIPLHAIEVIDGNTSEWRPIIHRNPIFYSHSHSLLRICLWNAQIASEAKVPLNPLIMNGIPRGIQTEEYTAGRDAVVQLAECSSTTALLDESATKTKFAEVAPDSRLIHIHSHIWWDDSSPLEHHIDLNNDKLAARDVFSIAFSKGTHVSLIACLGGRARISDGDEVMGLVPALLHSGASSTISTLWSIPDNIGARFTDAFYQNFFEQRKAFSGGEGFVNLAKVFQAAVKELALVEQSVSDDAGVDPKLHWTGFVMHGFWNFFVPQTSR